jgi:hypothetical protein
MKLNTHLRPLERTVLANPDQERRILYALRSFHRRYGPRWLTLDAIKTKAKVKSRAVVRQCVENLTEVGQAEFEPANSIARYSPRPD